MSKPTGREKAVVFGAPSLVGVAFLVQMLTRGAVSAVSLWVYLAVAAWLIWWLRRRAKG